MENVFSLSEQSHLYSSSQKKKKKKNHFYSRIHLPHFVHNYHSCQLPNAPKCTCKRLLARKNHNFPAMQGFLYPHGYTTLPRQLCDSVWYSCLFSCFLVCYLNIVFILEEQTPKLFIKSDFIFFL